MSRALSPVVGVLFLVGVTVLLATTVGALAAVDPAPVAPTAQLSLSADASQDRVALTHEGGETLAEVPE